MCQLESEGAGVEWSWERRGPSPSVSAPELSKPASVNHVSQARPGVISDQSVSSERPGSILCFMSDEAARVPSPDTRESVTKEEDSRSHVNTHHQEAALQQYAQGLYFVQK